MESENRSRKKHFLAYFSDFLVLCPFCQEHWFILQSYIILLKFQFYSVEICTNITKILIAKSPSTLPRKAQTSSNRVTRPSNYWAKVLETAPCYTNEPHLLPATIEVSINSKRTIFISSFYSPVRSVNYKIRRTV